MLKFYLKLKQQVEVLPIVWRLGGLIAMLFVIMLLWYFFFLHGLMQKRVILQHERQELLASVAALKAAPANGNQAATAKVVMTQDAFKLLVDFLRLRQDLVLLKIENLPVRKVTNKENSGQLFEHGLALTFKGNYFATYNYLRELEKLKWQIFWDRLQYQVTEYPLATVTLKVHILSDAAGLIHET